MPVFLSLKLVRSPAWRSLSPPARVLYVGDDPVKDGAAVRAGMPVYLLPTERDVGTPRGLSAVLRLVAAGDRDERVRAG